MRNIIEKQTPLMPLAIDHPQAAELDRVGSILDANPQIFELAMEDLSQGVKNSNKGAKGMTAEQIVKAAIVKQMFGYSYKDLAFHLLDSTCLRRFLRIGFVDKGFKHSVLCKNIKSLSPETWKAINDKLMSYSRDNGIEKGREARIDCTAVESNIHEPKDSILLWDCVRVLTHLLTTAQGLFGSVITFTDHTKRAKRRMLGIENSKNDKERYGKYLDLIRITRKTLNYAQTGGSILKESNIPDIRALAIAIRLEEYADLTVRVINQTERRIIGGETVPAKEKIFSIFETHTDIIVKDRRDPVFGHKVCLTQGASNLILDCMIVDGNPADSTLTIDMLDRQKDLYGQYPLKVALDGGFASKANLEAAKSRNIKDVCFAKRRGLEVEDMCRSEFVYNRLRRFRAGIESGISWLKRCFGVARCTWKGLRSFKSYVWASIVAANLLTMARKQIA